MRAHRTQLVIILSSMLLAACSTPSIHEPLPDAARGDIASTDVVVPIRQSEIYVFVPRSQAGAMSGGGLLGALIDITVDKVRTSKAEDAVTSLRNAMVDYSFDTAFADDLKASLPQIDWLHANGFRVVRDVSNDGLAATLAASHASDVFVIAADYRLSNDGDTLMVTVEAAIYPNTDALKALRTGKVDDKKPASLFNAIYRNRFVFEAHVQNTGDRDRNMAEWSAAKASSARAALTMASKKLVPLMVEDLQRTHDDVAPPSTAPLTAVALPDEATDCQIVPSEAQCGKSGQLLRQDQDGSVFRFKDGSIKYLKTGNF